VDGEYLLAVLEGMLRDVPVDPLPYESPEKSANWARARRATLEEVIGLLKGHGERR
jgi:hypothetical protein